MVQVVQFHKHRLLFFDSSSLCLLFVLLLYFPCQSSEVWTRFSVLHLILETMFLAEADNVQVLSCKRSPASHHKERRVWLPCEESSQPIRTLEPWKHAAPIKTFQHEKIFLVLTLRLYSAPCSRKDKRRGTRLGLTPTLFSFRSANQHQVQTSATAEDQGQN